MATSWTLEELVDFMICPACKAKLELKADRNGIRCGGCHRLYPVRDGLPIMLIDEATLDE